MSRDDFLSRWSRRKAASKAEEVRTGADPVAPAREIPSPAAAARGVPAAGAVAESPATPLPPVESLTPESDFVPFMRADVDPDVRRAAMRTLMRDPRFNVMDGLDVYIDDYSKPDPLPPEWLAQLNQVKRLGSYVEPEPEPESEAGEAAAIAPQAGPAEVSSTPEPPAAVDTSVADGKAQQAENPPESKNEIRGG